MTLLGQGYVSAKREPSFLSLMYHSRCIEYTRDYACRILCIFCQYAIAVQLLESLPRSLSYRLFFCLIWIHRLIQAEPLISKGIESLRTFDSAEAHATKGFYWLSNQFRITVASVVSLACYKF